MDKNPASISQFTNGLRSLGADVFTFNNLDDAQTLLSQRVTNVDHVPIDIILLDIKLADEQAFSLIKTYKENNPFLLLYITLDSGFKNVDTELNINALGIDDFLQKPLQFERFGSLIELTLGRKSSQSTSLTLTEPLIGNARPFFLFRSSAMRSALMNLPEIAESRQHVLITGETGTGKEIIARAIHALSKLQGHFVAVNCGAIPEGLIEGELFGHEKGAFTGAIKTRKGKFELAEGGTLLLDEIGDMPLGLQMRLLRVLEDGYVYRVGGETPIALNMRIISATRVDLKKAVIDKLFREDLYYRLNILNIHLPPLRERKEDISYLSVFFMQRAFAQLGRQLPYPSLSPETIHILENHIWSGNVRELRNLITRLAVILPKNINQVLPIHILPHIEDEAAAPININNEAMGVVPRPFFSIQSPLILSKLEDDYIKKVLSETNGNRTNAAKILGISTRTLRRKLNS
ncbi:MAG: sigma-54-dependent Fis family transcriptional regulator [Nitrospirae bacterium]|nr:sigma-54-dependent Fis family transcriptional regulator [Nitrospirota bacterium]